MNTQFTVQLKRLSVDFDDRFAMRDIDWRIDASQHWMICGANGSGKSALAAILAGAGEITAGMLSGVPKRIGIVSLEEQAALIDAERRKDDADILDVISEGTPASELIDQLAVDKQLAAELVIKFGLTHLLDRAFRKLSTGETRKVLLLRALACKPELLILDEPFEGLDAHTIELLQAHLHKISASIPMILVLNRLDECPDFVTDVAYVENGQLLHKVPRSNTQACAELFQLLHLKTSNLQVPAGEPESTLPALDATMPLVRLRNVCIQYGDTVIFKDLDWAIEANQHWQLSGPNGSGKTALLSLITGDHPQCYVNDIYVFGFQRGSGESIWQIKQFIGYVSTALQWEYRVGTSLRNVIISGFYDSIGLYTKYTDQQREIADQWLTVLGLEGRADEPFNKLSYGDQRLLLIARAMVKHPPLLILDEPCLGLDDMNRQLVLALIEKICAGSETSVLYVNHHANDKIAGIDHFLSLGS